MGIKCPKCHSDNPSDSKFCKDCGTQLLPKKNTPLSKTITIRTPVKEVNIGEIIAEKYKLIEELGKGGMGIVYKAEQIKPVKRGVALKVIKLGMDTSQVVARFEAERQALAVMDHPYIAKVFDGGATETGRPYFVMEFVRGMPFTEYCDKHKLSTSERLKLFMPLCQAVQHAHQKGVIHRDLKPSNILVVVQEDKPIPKIIDFGIAKATEHSLTERTLFTEQGQLIGTPEYMSPEQAEMSGLDVDTRTDIYSLGVILYELLVGVLPFDPKSLREAGFGEIQRIIRETEPPKASTRLSSLGDTQTSIAEHRKTDPNSLKRELKGDLDWITVKAMAKDRTQRYASASELAADIEKYLRHEPVTAVRPSAKYRIKKYIRKHKVGVAAAVLVIIAIMVGITGTTIGLLKAKRAEKIAVEEAERASKEAETTKQVSDFLVDLFEVSDPSEARGNSITAREVLDKGVTKVEEELKDQPEIQATLIATMGNVYQNLGLYDQATPLLENALTIRRHFYGEEHLAVCTSMNDLANLYIDKADFDAAELLLRDAIEIHRKTKGDQEEYGDLLSNLAGLSLERGDFDAAESLFREELAIRRKLKGDDDPSVASVLHNLGGVCNERGDYKGAEALFRESLELRLDLLGTDHPETASSMAMLAQILQHYGEYEKAEQLFRDALAIRRKLYGNEHPHTALNINNLGTLFSEMGDYDTAESFYRESLEIQRKVFGNKHPYVAISLNNLATCMQKKGVYGKAEKALRECLSIFREALGNEHPNVAHVMNNLAVVLTKMKKYTEAEHLFTEALAMRRTIFGDGSPDVAFSLYTLADMYEDMGNYHDAASLWQESLEIRQNALPAGHLHTIKSKRELGNCLAKLKRFEEAEKLLLECYENLESKSKISKEDITKTLEYIVDLYITWGKPEKAAVYRVLLEGNEIKK
jgi:serine/threonine protein kinase/Tfp pilus assembly protein PilF